MAKLITTRIWVVLEGLAAIMFDRFIDHSAEVRPPEQKLYLAEDNQVVLPAENIYSFLLSENPAGCAKGFEGKKGKQYISVGMASIFVDPVLIPFKHDGQLVKFTGFDDGVFSTFLLAPRTKKGTLSIKQEARPRPILSLPWSLEFTITLVENEFINEGKLHNWFDRGGIMIALGTFRPRFGRFMVKEWKIL